MEPYLAFKLMIRIFQSQSPKLHRAQNEIYSSRLRPREGAMNPVNRFSKIIVEFARRSVKDQFYQGRKFLKDITKDLGFSPSTDSPNFISESLTSKNKELFKNCLMFKKDHSFRYIWTTIYIKRSSNTYHFIERGFGCVITISKLICVTGL